MLFNSLNFLIFLPVVFAVHYSLPARFRWAWLLAASCYFYAAYVPAYLFVLGGLIIGDYTLARLMQGRPASARRLYLALSIIGNIGALFFFKYFNFFQTDVVSGLAQAAGIAYRPSVLHVLLPLGLSFHVFQSLSYIIEVYRGHFPVERHIGIYALYVMFFPQLVAGPIERPAELLPELHAARAFEYGRAVRGARLIIWGFFKKLVVADQLGLLVDAVFNNVGAGNGVLFAGATIAFALELYGDFSGYTDIARGSAELLGIGLVRNFNNPYASRSIAEFWRRWHISLSSWFRDYFYFPLSYKLRRLRAWGGFISMFVTFSLLGLWHGAAWTYVAMGALNGLYIICGALTKTLRARFVSAIGLNRLPRLHKIFQIVFTFALVCLGWLFFRANTMTDAWYMIRNLASGWESLFNVPYLFDITSSIHIGLGRRELLTALAAAAGMFMAESFGSHLGVEQKLDTLPRPARWCFYYAITLSILLFGFFGAKPFIYFQF